MGLMFPWKTTKPVFKKSPVGSLGLLLALPYSTNISAIYDSNLAVFQKKNRLMSRNSFSDRSLVIEGLRGTQVISLLFHFVSSFRAKRECRLFINYIPAFLYIKLVCHNLRVARSIVGTLRPTSIAVLAVKCHGW